MEKTIFVELRLPLRYEPTFDKNPDNDGWGKILNASGRVVADYVDVHTAKFLISAVDEITRLQGREKEAMELLNDARGHLVLNPSYPSKQVVIGKIDALLSRYSGEQQKENV